MAVQDRGKRLVGMGARLGGIRCWIFYINQQGQWTNHLSINACALI
jgi:hypothetical protein